MVKCFTPLPLFFVAVSSLHKLYADCLAVVKKLSKNQMFESMDMQSVSVSADSILYAHALEAVRISSPLNDFSTYWTVDWLIDRVKVSVVDLSIDWLIVCMCCRLIDWLCVCVVDRLIDWLYVLSIDWLIDLFCSFKNDKSVITVSVGRIGRVVWESGRLLQPLRHCLHSTALASPAGRQRRRPDDFTPLQRRRAEAPLDPSQPWPY